MALRAHTFSPSSSQGQGTVLHPLYGPLLRPTSTEAGGQWGQMDEALNLLQLFPGHVTLDNSFKPLCVRFSKRNNKVCGQA